MNPNHFAIHQGKIVYVPDVPEKPAMGMPSVHLHQISEYEVNINSAIANGIDVDDPDQLVMKKLYSQNGVVDGLPENFYSWKEKAEGKLYPLQCRVEVHNIKGPFPLRNFVQVARVTFDEQPEYLENEGDRMLKEAFAKVREAAGQEQPPILKPVAYQRGTGSHLPYGRYLVIRKDGKTHLETYNGTGWAYNDNAITFYYLPKIS